LKTENKTKGDITIKNFEKSYGRFFKLPNKFGTEIDPPNSTKILLNKSFRFGSCGQTRTNTGTEWTFEIYTTDGKFIARLHWDSPWSGTNVLNTEERTEGYIIDINGFNIGSDTGALGTGDITVYKL
jgi:hypothetical protein